MITEPAFGKEMMIRVVTLIAYAIPLFYREMQIADRPKHPLIYPHFRGQDLVRTIAMQPVFDSRPLLTGQPIGILARPTRFQPGYALFKILLDPSSHRAFTSSHHCLNSANSRSCPVQTDCLQPPQFQRAARLLFGALQFYHLFFAELKLSFRHSTILHHVNSFSLHHKVEWDTS